jgi:hypothetical protein
MNGDMKQILYRVDNKQTQTNHHRQLVAGPNWYLGFVHLCHGIITEKENLEIVFCKPHNWH